MTLRSSNHISEGKRSREERNSLRQYFLFLRVCFLSAALPSPPSLWLRTALFGAGNLLPSHSSAASSWFFIAATKWQGTLELVKGFNFDLTRYHFSKTSNAHLLSKINAVSFTLALSVSWDVSGTIVLYMESFSFELRQKEHVSPRTPLGSKHSMNFETNNETRALYFLETHIYWKNCRYATAQVF